jgi:hypothetical protein
VADVSHNTILGYVDHGTAVGILAWGGSADYPPPEYRPTVTVTDNILTGMDTGPGGHPRPFNAGAIEMRNGTGTEVSRNIITNANWAISLFQNGRILSGSDNVADGLHGILRAYLNSIIYMEGNDFTDWNVSLHDSDGSMTGSLACNWWGSGDGPSNNDFPHGSSVVYWPWADGAVAGGGSGSCTVGPSGTVTGTVAAEGEGLAGVPMELAGPVTLTMNTGSGGSYTFDDVPLGSYTLSISSPPEGTSFSTTSFSVSLSSNGQVVSVDFSGSFVRTASISGTVTSGGVPLAGVSVILDGPDGGSSTTTGSLGQYSFLNLRSGEYTVTAGTLSQSLTLGVGEAAVVDFSGTPEPRS